MGCFEEMLDFKLSIVAYESVKGLIRPLKVGCGDDSSYERISNQESLLSLRDKVISFLSVIFLWNSGEVMVQAVSSNIFKAEVVDKQMQKVPTGK